MYNVKIESTGRYVPDNIVTNEDISKIVDTSDNWITERTGIKERRISKGENTSHMAIKSAKDVLKKSSIKATEVDLIIVATCTPDCFVPSTACVVQHAIGATKATCFDISAACTGFMYALGVASQFIKTGQCKNALVIGAETLSKMISWDDRDTCILFGDGAGSAIVSRSENVGLISQYTCSDGSGGEFLKCNALPVENPYVSIEEQFQNKLSMQGREVFRFAVKAMINSIKKVLENTNYTIEDVDYIVPHQANLRIIEYVAKKLNVPQHKFYINLDRYGNTSGASIAIALDEMNENNMLKKGDKIILVGFGGGLTFGAHLIQWS